MAPRAWLPIHRADVFLIANDVQRDLGGLGRIMRAQSRSAIAHIGEDATSGRANVVFMAHHAILLKAMTAMKIAEVKVAAVKMAAVKIATVIAGGDDGRLQVWHATAKRGSDHQSPAY